MTNFEKFYQPIALFHTIVGTGYPSAWQCNSRSFPAETLISFGSTTQCGGTVIKNIIGTVMDLKNKNKSWMKIIVLLIKNFCYCYTFKSWRMNAQSIISEFCKSTRVQWFNMR